MGYDGNFVEGSSREQSSTRWSKRTSLPSTSSLLTSPDVSGSRFLPCETVIGVIDK